MEARDVFGVVVRTVGLVVALYGIQDIVSGIVAKIEAAGITIPPTMNGGFITGPSTEGIALGIVAIGTGLWLLLSAQTLVNYCYPGTADARAQADQDP